jgi:hypothetical protein
MGRVDGPVGSIEQELLVAALLALSWNTGVALARLRSRGPLLLPARAVALGAAGALVLAWGVAGGALLAGRSSAIAPLPDLLLDAPGLRWRIAALWASPAGGLASLALVMAMAAALLPRASVSRSRARLRLDLYVGAAAMLALAAWTAAETTPDAVSIPPYLLHGAAALASATALLSGSFLGILVLAWVAARESRVSFGWERRLAIISWILATISLGAEQAARQDLGLGPGVAVVWGSSFAVLVLWLAAAAGLCWQLPELRTRSPLPTALRWGRVLSWGGAMMMLLAFLAHAAAKRKNFSLAPGASLELRGLLGRSWRVTGSGVSRFDLEGIEVTVAAVALASGESKRLLAPELRQYLTTAGETVGSPVRRAATWHTLTGDLRFLLLGVGADEVANLRFSFVPLAAFWPVGLLAMLWGSVLLGLDSHRAGREGVAGAPE